MNACQLLHLLEPPSVAASPQHRLQALSSTAAMKYESGMDTGIGTRREASGAVHYVMASQSEFPTSCHV